MNASSKTAFDVRCDIISDFWVADDVNLQDLYEDYEIPFSIVFCSKYGFVEPTPTYLTGLAHETPMSL